MLQRAGPIVVGVANIFAAASGLELDLDSEQAVIERLLGLGCDLRVPFRSFHSHGRLIPGRSQRFSPGKRRCSLGLGGPGGGGLRLQV